MRPARRINAGPRPASRQDAGAPGDVRSAGILPASAGAEGRVVWRSRGYLPHIDMPNLVQHVIIRLADSLPIEARKALDRGAAAGSGCGCRCSTRPRIWQTRPGRSAHRRVGPKRAFDLRRRAIRAARLVRDAKPRPRPARRSGRRQAAIGSYIPGNPTPLSQANRLLGRTGPFWAREYFDRFMRDAEHLARTAAYIEGNPVKAGLCENCSGLALLVGLARLGRALPACGRLAGRMPALRRHCGNRHGTLPAAGHGGAGDRGDLCLHGARGGDDLPGDRPSQFRAGRDGDVLDLHRLAAACNGACRIGSPSSLAVLLSFVGGVADRAGPVPADPQRAGA